MGDIVETALAAILKHGMIPPDSVVMATVSGGPDSVALTLALLRLKDRLKIKELKICHYDHALRPDSGVDAQFARAFAEKLGLDFVMGRNTSGKPISGVQNAAREMRYAFFDRLLDEGWADIAATGHTADDSVETFMLWLFRGSGPQALAGIPPVRGRYVRPLIETRKSGILSWLERERIGFVTDPTNKKDDYLRNRIRHHLIPAMESISPTAIDAIERVMRLVGGQSALVARIAEEKMKDAVTGASHGSVTLNPSLIRGEPEALRLVIYRQTARLAGLDPSALSLRHLDALDGLLTANHKGASTHLPQGYAGSLDHAGLTIHKRKEPPVIGETLFTCPLGVAFGGGTLIVTPAKNHAPGKDAMSLSAVPRTAVFRVRAPGDFLRLANLEGRKKLKTFLIDRKVPSRVRDGMPLLAVESEILWIPGLYLSPSIRAGAGSENIAILEWRPQ